MIKLLTPTIPNVEKLNQNESDNINIYRMFLVQWVIFSHLFYAIFGIMGTPGRLAVWCFFVISGYLNFLSICPRVTALGYKKGVVEYYKARIIRIYPLLILSYLVISISLGTLLNTDLGVIFPYAFFVRDEFSPNNGPLWTLVVELQLYMLTPIIFLFSFKMKSEFKYVLSIIILFIFSVTVAYIFVVYLEKDSYWDDRTMLSALPMYFFGMLLAKNRNELIKLDNSFIKFTTIFSMAALIAVIGHYNNLWWHFGYLFREGRIIPFTISLIVIAKSYCIFLTPKKFHQLFVFWGKLTYEIYLFHGLFLFLLMKFQISGNIVNLVLFYWILPMATAHVYSLLASNNFRHVNNLLKI